MTFDKRMNLCYYEDVKEDKGTFNSHELSVANFSWFPPKSALELGGFLLY